MKKSFVTAALLLMLVGAPACDRGRQKATGTAGEAGNAGPPLTEQETRVKQAIALLDQATDLMNSIHDRTSATAAAPKLKEIARQLEALHRQGVPLGSEVGDKPEALGRFRRDMEKATERCSKVAVVLLDQENNLGPDFPAALRELGRVIH